jgi:S1-C subfamily serine protease
MKPRTFYTIVFAVSLLVGMAVGQVVQGQEWTPPPDNKPIPKGVGFQGAVPSWLIAVKVVDRHSGELEWIGSGSFIGSRLILTCSHNVEDMTDDMTIKIQTTAGYMYTNVKVVHQDEDVDLALLKVLDPLLLYHTSIVVEDTDHVPRHVSSAGYCPRDNGMSLFGGIIGNYVAQDTPDGPKVYRSTSAYLEPGMSGGPLINGNLNLHGIMVWRHESNEDEPKWIRSFFVRLAFIQAFLDEYDGPFED